MFQFDTALFFGSDMAARVRNDKKAFLVQTQAFSVPFPTKIYRFKANNRNNRKRFEMCPKLTIKIPDYCFIVDFQYISLLTLNN